MWDELGTCGINNTTGNTLRCNGFNLTVKYASEHLNDDHDDHVWRRTNVECDLKNAILIAKHTGGTVMLWGCFSTKGTRRFHRDTQPMDVSYISARTLKVGQEWAVQHDSDPKHTRITLMSWSGLPRPQSYRKSVERAETLSC